MTEELVEGAVDLCTVVATAEVLFGGAGRDVTAVLAAVPVAAVRGPNEEEVEKVEAFEEEEEEEKEVRGACGVVTGAGTAVRLGDKDDEAEGALLAKYEAAAEG